MLGRIVMIAATMAVGLSSTAMAAGGHRGSMEDQIACTPDVYRLCSALIPDEDAIVDCLKKHRNTLSSACGKVFDKPDPGSEGGSDD